jgi:quercetin dioxygenase-like cupin family protein
MTDDVDAERLLDNTSLALVKSLITLEPGRVLAYDEAAWHDAIVFVTAGEIELECLSGTVHRFCRGDILWLEHLQLRAVRNAAPVEARLVAISRRAHAIRSHSPRALSRD